jgi:NAD-dependent dihydropyrimidine dehydrogenase PreA subunit
VRRKIVQIDEAKCDGCGQCVPACAEGAISLAGGKARLAADVLCDGLGACLGECPRGAIRIEEREAAPFDHAAVEMHLARAGPAAPPPRPRLAVVTDPGPAGGGCPGSASRSLPRRPLSVVPDEETPRPAGRESRLAHWPVQLHLVPPQAPWLRDADLLVAADCVPFAYARFHEDLLEGRVVVVGCPKLDDLRAYLDKLAAIFATASPRSVTVARLEVPCCGGISAVARQALAQAGSPAPFREVVVSVDGVLRS